MGIQKLKFHLMEHSAIAILQGTQMYKWKNLAKKEEQKSRKEMGPLIIKLIIIIMFIWQGL